MIRVLTKAGFCTRGGKGSHLNFTHPNGTRITLCGKPSDDAKAYQERDVAKALKLIEVRNEDE